MFNLLMILLVTLASSAGVGGISGGHVEFQRASTFVSVMDKTLCHDNMVYKAIKLSCVITGSGDNSPCLQEKNITITQPIESTRQVCKEYGGREQNFCREWEVVRFYQNPVMSVDMLDTQDRVVDRKTISVPQCR